MLQCKPKDVFMQFSAAIDFMRRFADQLLIDISCLQCDAGIGIKNFFDLWKDKRIFAILTGCSSVSTPIAESAYLWNINVIAFGASSPALSNRSACYCIACCKFMPLKLISHTVTSRLSSQPFKFASLLSSQKNSRKIKIHLF